MVTVFDALNPPLAHRIADALERLGGVARAGLRQSSRARRVNPLQARILCLLLGHGGTLAGAHRLAAMLAVTPATVSGSLAVLTRKGLIAKERAAGRAGALRLALTAAGRDLAEALTAPAPAVEQALLALDAAEQTALLRALIKMIRALQQQGRIAVARMCVSCRHFRPHVYADPALPHHCALVDAAFGDRHLRIDCAEHDEAPAADAEACWRRFAAGAAA